MDIEKTLGLIMLAWLVGAFLLMVRLIRRGQKLAAVFAKRYPEAYEAQGRPRPGLMQSARGREFSQFISKHAYKDLGDPALAAQFEAYRKAEARLLVLLLVSLAILASLLLVVRYGLQ